MKSPPVQTDLFPMQIWVPWHKDVRKLILYWWFWGMLASFSVFGEPTSQKIKARGLPISLNFKIYVPQKLILFDKRKSLSKYIEPFCSKTHSCILLTLGKDKVKQVNGTTAVTSVFWNPKPKIPAKTSFNEHDHFTIDALKSEQLTNQSCFFPQYVYLLNIHTGLSPLL